MSILLVILEIIGAILILFFLVALFVKKEYAIQRDVIIRKPAAEVFNFIRCLKNQDYYSKWVMSDPEKKTTFTGTDGAVGFIYAWDSKNKSAGKGEQEITKITENKSVAVEIRFEKPFEGVAQTLTTTEQIANDQTKVTWSMEGKSKYPMNIMNLFMGKMLGDDLQTSLNNLKNLLESK